MNHSTKVTACCLAAALTMAAASNAQARDSGQSDTPAQSNAEASPVPSEPQQTSASFGDWTVRCDRPAIPKAKRVCEAAQSMIIKGQQAPIAQVAFGHQPTDNGVDPALTLTILLPVSIAFDKVPKLGAGAGIDDMPAATLTFRRCVPGGCLADAKPDAALLKGLRTASKPGHLTFTDAAERSITLPVSFRGLAQALDDLAKEDDKDVGKTAANSTLR